MNRTETKPIQGYGLLVGALIGAILVLGAVNISRWFRTRERPGDAPDVQRTVAPPVPAASTGARAVGSGAAAPDGLPVRAPQAERGGQVGERGAAAESPGGQTSPGSSQVAGRESAAAPAATAAPATPGPPPQQGVRAPGAALPPGGKNEPGKDSAAPPDGSDRTPPVLRQLLFEPGVVEGGHATTLTIDASDNLSGVKSVRGEIQSPSGKALLSLYPQESHGGNSFTYVVNIPPAAEAGIWFVKWLYLTDMADNSSLVQVTSPATAPPGGTFSVTSSQSDSIPPDVLGVSFAKELIQDEDRNVIRVEAKDDLSGVTAVSGACQSPSKSAVIPFTCALDEASGLWEGNVMLPASVDCGVWSVQQLSAKDKAGNTTQLASDSPILAHAGFTIAGRADCDSTPPTLDAFVLSQTIVPGDAATEILISAGVHDVGSGAVSLAGWFEGPVSEGGQIPKNHFTCTPDPEHPDGPWTGKLEVPQFAPKGTWKVRVVRLEDKALNVREYTPADAVLSGGVFEVR
jgi:hypothetical protein